MPAQPNPATMTPIEIETLGLGARLVDYQWAWDYQREVHAKVASGVIPGRVLLLEHEAVYTAGRQTRPEERPFDGTPVVDVDRGGKITWHGPGQLVGYPIVRLPGRVGVVDHVRRMEQAVIDMLGELGIDGVRIHGRTGVWLPAVDPAPVTASGAQIWDSAHGARRGDERSDPATPAPTRRVDADEHAEDDVVPLSLRKIVAAPAKPERKICAIGIRVAKRTTMHGFAVNISNQSTAFENIIPCGISDAGVTSIAAELGAAPPLGEIARLLAPHLTRCFDYAVPLGDVVR